ncbi:hypothetical protein [Spongiimicrobium salis]|uniref:hypothetical protein n=1 Tax=Spongiimicrobium salis TaxID=1667022 RepID=UPI00374D1B62
MDTSSETERNGFMDIKCIRTGGFIGQIKECTLLLTELTEQERKAFEVIKIARLTLSEDIQDSFVYCLKFTENNIKRKLLIEESNISVEMRAFIQKIDARL